jgi:hypothetical protein
MNNKRKMKKRERVLWWELAQIGVSLHVMLNSLPHFT